MLLSIQTPLTTSSIEEYPSQCDELIQRVVRFICHVFRMIQTLFTAFSWEIDHWDHWVGESLLFTSPFSYLSEAVIEDEAFQKSMDAYCRQSHMSSTQVKVQLLWNLFTGKCHGMCLELLSKIQQSPNTPLEYLNLDSDHIALYQSLEFFRNKLSLETISAIQNPVSIHQFTIQNQDLNQEICTCLNAGEILIIRCWDTLSAHTFLLYASPTHNHYYFFNSQLGGLFRYTDTQELITAFLSHVESHSSYASQGNFWQLETYKKDKANWVV